MIDKNFDLATIQDAEFQNKLRSLVRIGHLFSVALSGRSTLTEATIAVAELCHSNHVSLMRFSHDAESLDVINETKSEERYITEDDAIALSHTNIGQVLSLSQYHGAMHMFLLANSPEVTDLAVIATRDQTWLSILAAELPKIWNAQSSHVMDGMIADPDGHVDRLILSSSNPYGLTKAETQVCFCLADGLRPAAMTQRLNCSMPTIRTHLRNIYNKTGLDGMVAVVHQLHLDAGDGPR